MASPIPNDSYTAFGKTPPALASARLSLMKTEQERQKKPKTVGPAAQKAVELYRSLLARYLDVHRVALKPADWAAQARPSPPREPARTAHHEDAAKVDLFTYHPEEADRLDGRAARVVGRLLRGVREAQRADDLHHERQLTTFRMEYAKWDRTAGFARRVLAQQPDALRQVLDLSPPCAAFADCLVGSGVTVSAGTPASVHVQIEVRPSTIFPSERPTLLLPEHRLVGEPVTLDEVLAQHRAYVSGAVLRAALEVVARVPVPSVLVTASEGGPILRAEIDREALLAMHLPRLDPVETLAAFQPHERWHPLRGFRPLS